MCTKPNSKSEEFCLNIFLSFYCCLLLYIYIHISTLPSSLNDQYKEHCTMVLWPKRSSAAQLCLQLQNSSKIGNLKNRNVSPTNKL